MAYRLAASANDTCIPDPALILRLVGVDIGSTIGIGYFAVVLSLVFYGVTCCQTFNYYQSRKAQSDTWMLKSLVAVLLVLDSVHQAFIVHVGYHYLVLNYANPGALLLFTWTLPAEMILNIVIGAIVQRKVFLVARIWGLSRNKWAVGFCAFWIVAALAIVPVYPVKVFLNPATAATLLHFNPWIVIGSCASLAADALIAATMSFYLYQRRTGFRRSDNIIWKLIALTITTGSLTTCFALASLVSYVAAPFTFLDLFFNYQLSKLFTNSLLTILNSREFVRGMAQTSMHTDQINSIPLTRLGIERKDGAIRIPRPMNVVLDVETDAAFVFKRPNAVELGA